MTNLPRPLTEEQAAAETAMEMNRAAEKHVETTRKRLHKLDPESTKRMEAGDVPFGLS